MGNCHKDNTKYLEKMAERLSQLHEYTKWQFKKNNIKIMILVLLKENNLSICHWILGKSVEVNPGGDGKIRQGVDNQGNHGKIRDLYNSGKVMEKSGNFVKISPNQGTLHFCLLNVAKKSSNRRYQKKQQEEKEIK